MAVIGLAHLFAAPIDVEGAESVTYKTGAGFEIASMVEANETIESNSVKFYANNRVKETDTSFSTGAIALSVDDLTIDTRAKLLGHKTKTINGVEGIVANSGDSAPYLGVTYIRYFMLDGVRRYEVTWYFKTKFSEPNRESTTKTETTEFKPTSLNGIILELGNGDWHYVAEFDDEVSAVAFAKKTLGIEA